MLTCVQAKLQRHGFVLEQPSVFCLLQNLQNAAWHALDLDFTLPEADDLSTEGLAKELCSLKSLQVAFGLMLLALVGLIFGLLGMLGRDRLLSWNSFLLCFTALGSALTVGSDPCFLQHLRDSVALLGFQNRRLRESNEKLEQQVLGLSHVNGSLNKVCQQMGDDAEATQELLTALWPVAPERFWKDYSVGHSPCRSCVSHEITQKIKERQHAHSSHI